MLRQISTFAVALLLAVGMSYAAEQGPGAADQPDQGQKRKTPEQFVKKAASGNMMEVQLGEMAQRKGHSDAVKEYGVRLSKDHRDAQDKLAKVAQSLDMALPTTLDENDQKTVDRLSKLDGGETFDRELITTLVKDHRKDIRMYENARQSDNEKLKEYVDEVLPTLRAHLTQGEQVAQQVGAQVEPDRHPNRDRQSGAIDPATPAQP